MDEIDVLDWEHAVRDDTNLDMKTKAALRALKSRYPCMRPGLSLFMTDLGCKDRHTAIKALEAARNSGYVVRTHQGTHKGDADQYALSLPSGKNHTSVKKSTSSDSTTSGKNHTSTSVKKSTSTSGKNHTLRSKEEAREEANAHAVRGEAASPRSLAKTRRKKGIEDAASFRSDFEAAKLPTTDENEAEIYPQYPERYYLHNNNGTLRRIREGSNAKLKSGDKEYKTGLEAFEAYKTWVREEESAYPEEAETLIQKFEQKYDHLINDYSKEDE